MKKKILSLLTMLCMVMTLLPVNVAFAATVDSGTCGDNLTWTLDDAGTLTISGTGNMNNYTYYTSLPWDRTITSAVINEGVTSIGTYAFSYCSSLASVTIPNSVTSIGGSAFRSCSSLASVTIPNSVTTIGSSAFFECYNLDKVYITDIAAYLNCDYGDWASNPRCYDGKLYLNGKRVAGNLVIPDGVKVIPSGAFSNCSSLTSVTIPGSVTTIGDYAFQSCSSLTSVTIPNSVTTIGDSAFCYCSSLTSVTIPNSVTTIGEHAFSNCSSLASVTIPNSVTTIGERAFSYCSSLASVTIPNSVTTIGGSAFSNCSSLASVTIPNSVTTIGDSAFFNCSSLTSVTIPNSVTTIGGSAFSNCSSLTSVTIPNGVTSISGGAFSDCDKLTNVTFGEGISEIEGGTFIDSGVKYVVIPKSVTEINQNAFSGCSNLSLVFYAGSEEEWDEVFVDSGNDYLKSATKIYNSKKRTYKFETNCDNKLADITDYAVFEAPSTENGEKRLAGWYDNAALSGSPVSFPYYGTSSTLYAEWTDRTGSGFDDAIVIKENSRYTVSPTASRQYVYYEFSPKYTGEYSFYSEGSIDTYAELYNSAENYITSNDDGGESNNFKITYSLKAGEKYYIAAKCYSGVHDFTLVTETISVSGTKTAVQSMQGGIKLFVVTPTDLPTGARISLALYSGDELVDVQSAENTGSALYFMSSVPYTSAKVMAWDNLSDMSPLCEAEVVK